MKKYNEPSWNNPVVRIVNADGENIVERVNSDYSVAGLLNAMEKALLAEDKEIPRYMELLIQETGLLKEPAVEYYSMYCFWSGEKELGAVREVIYTEAGFVGGQEVVKSYLILMTLSVEALDEYAKSKKIFTT